MNDVFSELQCEEEFEYKEVAGNSTTHGPAAIPFILNNNKKRKHRSWDDSFQELVDFKGTNGHTNVRQRSGPLGTWVRTQREAFRRLKEVEHSPSTNDKREKLESIGFVFKCRPTGLPWDQRFQELVDFKKINGHANVPQKFGQLGNWVSNQRTEYRLLKEGKHSTLTNYKCEKLESIGLELKCRPTPTGPPWDQRFQELVDFKKINGHTNVPTKSGPLGTWVRTQRKQYHLYKEGKYSPFTNDRREKLESIAFVFVRRSTITPWDQRFQELVDFKKINEHTNVPQKFGPIGSWVNVQRREFRRLEGGKYSALTNERRDKLDSIGFSFNIHKKS
eukprot:scaffold21187_cov54-Attheya_sp.AAC.7